MVWAVTLQLHTNLSMLYVGIFLKIGDCGVEFLCIKVNRVYCHRTVNVFLYL